MQRAPGANVLRAVQALMIGPRASPSATVRLLRRKVASACAGVRCPSRASSRATVPETCAAAIDEPEAKS
jgi:hypothetical protein